MKKVLYSIVVLGFLLSLFVVSEKSAVGGGHRPGGSTTSCTIVNANQLVPDPEIRLFNKEVEIEYTLQGNLKKTTQKWHDLLDEPNNMIISTEVDGLFRSRDVIKVRYKRCGVYKKYNQIDVIVTMNCDSPDGTEMIHFKNCGETWQNGSASRKKRNYSVFFTNDTTKKGYFDRANFFDGIRYSCVARPVFTYEFVYAGTNNRIPANHAWFSWGSVNHNEGVNSYNAYTEYFKRAGALPDVYNLETGFKANNSELKPLFFDIDAFNAYWWGNQLPFLFNTIGDDFEDHIGTEDFWKSIGSMYVETNTPGMFKFRMASPHYWFVPSMAALGPTAPEPEKFIKEGSELKKEVTKSPNETVVFRVLQDVSEYGYYGSSYEKYISFVMEDKLPQEVEYVSAKLIRSWEHSPYTSGSNTDVTNSAGTLSYNQSTHTVKYTFNSNYLSNEMRYEGETYALEITCRIKDTTRQQFTNTAKTYLCGDEQSTNIVTVKIETHKIETEVINGTIDPTEDGIPTGEDRTINYSPNEGYYLKEIIVDGTNVDISSYPSSYDFNDITEDHKIKVVYAKNPYITIQKKVDLSKVIWAKGTPEFFFKITGTDHQGINRTYYRYIGFTSTGPNEKEVKLYIPAGQWTVTEFKINDWAMINKEAILNGSVSGNSVVLDIREKDSATARFTNDISDYSNYTHNETKVNRLK